MDFRSRISSLNLTSLFALFVFLLCKLTSAFTIDSSTPPFEDKSTLRVDGQHHTFDTRVYKTDKFLLFGKFFTIIIVVQKDKASDYLNFPLLLLQCATEMNACYILRHRMPEQTKRKNEQITE
jgi:hypothetical protein